MTTGPVCMPMRTASRTPSGNASSAFSGSIASSIASPARIARSGSSSRAVGPAEVDEQAVAEVLARRGRRSARRRRAPPAGSCATTSRHSSASSCCESGVEPTRSQKRTVSWRRSPAGVEACAAGALGTGASDAARSPMDPPHSPQNFCSPDSPRRSAGNDAPVRCHTRRKTSCRRDSRCGSCDSGSRYPARGGHHSAHEGGKLPEDLIDHGRRCLADALGLARAPIEALDLIGQHHTRDRQTHGQRDLERISLHLAGDWAA